MPWRGPQFDGEQPSLGWDLIERWADLFPSPRDESEPFVLTDDQALIVVEWYTIDPQSGKFLYRRGCSRRAKGIGKSPIEAAKCISELALPVRFDGWNADGEPVGRPWGTMGDPDPWVQIASLSEDQDENTYSPLYFFLTANDGRCADELKVDAGLTRCFLRHRPSAKIEPVTSKAGSREGQPVTYGCLDESGYMTPENGGVKLARTIRRNATKMGGRTYETTNGYSPGENSVAEQTDKAILKGTAGIYCDAVEAPTHIGEVEVNLEAPDAVLREALSVAYGKAWWVDLDRIVADIRDPDNPWSDSERFFFNWNRKGEGRAVDPKLWEARKVARVDVPDGERVGLGFDGSISEDATALIGCTAAGYLFEIEVWERPLGVKSWRVPRLAVHAKVAECFDRWSVGRMFCDPPKWATEIEQWMELYNPEKESDAVVLFFDTNQARRMAPACDRFTTALAENDALSHSDDEVLTRHTLAMVKKKVRLKDEEDDGRTRYVFTKGPDGRKIDAGIGAVLAYEAAMTMPVVVPQAFFATHR